METMGNACALLIDASSARGVLSVVLILIVSLLAALTLMILFLKNYLRKVGRKAVSELEERYPGEEIIENEGANFFGRKSLGLGQIRGNGFLILTKRKLMFRQAAPSRWFEIPLDRIIEIEHPTNFMGKGCASKLLVVNYRNEEGEGDAIGWAVRDVNKWSALIENGLPGN